MFSKLKKLKMLNKKSLEMNASISRKKWNSGMLQTFDEKNENDRKTCKLTVCNRILQFGKKRSNNGCQINLKKSKKCSPFHSLFLPTPCFLIALAMVKPSVVGCSSSSLQGDTGDTQILDLFKDWSGKNCYSCMS